MLDKFALVLHSSTMCNRARNRYEPDILQDHFGTVFSANQPIDNRFDPIDLAPRGRAYVVRESDRGRCLDVMIWDVLGDAASWPMTNVRNLTLPRWRALAARPENRCLVPLSEFCVLTVDAHNFGGGKRTHRDERWFRVTDQPLFAVAGFWQPTAKGNGFTMVTCTANELVAVTHSKAMVTVLGVADHDRWLRGSYEDVVLLQQPYSSEKMAIEESFFPIPVGDVGKTAGKKLSTFLELGWPGIDAEEAKDAGSEGDYRQ